MKSSGIRSFSLGAFASLAASAALLTPATARADLPVPGELSLAKVKGWELAFDGRISTFLSVSRGDKQPATTALWQGIQDYPDANGNITDSRLRSGFVSNVFGWTLRKQVRDDTVITGRFAIWGNVSQQRDKTIAPALDMREVYLKVEGPWGAVLAGRNMGLFGRGGINLDYDIEHAYGLGHPCLVINLSGLSGPIAACGHVGHGILFPAFNAQITYNTPQFAGFQFSAGIFDPAAVQERSFDRTPYPRVEGELSFKVPKYFHAEISGSWQRLGQDDNLQINVDSLGFAYAAGVTLGPVQFGGAGFTGQGLGIYSALENYPIFSDDKFVLRHQSGYLGMAAVNFGSTKIAGGVGETLISKTANDPPGAFSALNFPRTQLGISAGIYQGVFDNLVLGLDVFRATYTFNVAIDPNTMAEFTPTQTVTFINAGSTLIF